MTANVTWFFMAAAGFGFRWMMRYTRWGWLDQILIRLAGCCWVGAGLAGLTGWAGQLLGWMLTTGPNLIDRISSDAVGGVVSGIIALGVSALWVFAMLPDRIFGYDPPDWLIYTGLIIPSLLATVPGAAGEALRAVITAAGTTVNTWVGGLV